ncbi:MAG: DNA polymerase III subunit beta [Acidithiobacillus sp.]|nr:DNA polymerase III subunit beta [Acidithiobacillus sp.]
MKLRLQREEILPVLAAMANIADRRPVQAILSHLLLTCTESSMEILGTDAEIQLQATLPVASAEPGQLAIPARKLYDIVRAIAENSELRIDHVGERVTIRAGNARFTLPTLSAHEYPRMQQPKVRLQGHCQGEDFQQALGIAATAMAHNDARFFLNGVLLEVQEQQLRLVATDGHRLALMEVPFAHDAEQASYQGIIPRKAVTELLRILEAGELVIRLSETACSFLQGQKEFSCRLIDAKYPDYRRVIPVGHPFEVHVERGSFKNALQQIDVISSDKSPACTLLFQGEQIILRSRNEEQAEGEVRIAASFQGSTTEISFNTRYLLDTQNIFNEEQLQLEIRDSSSSALIRGREQAYPLYVVMPIRL